MSDTISKEAMREARLRALGQQHAGVGSGEENEGAGPPETEEEGWMVVDATNLPPLSPSTAPAAPATTTTTTTTTASSDGRPMTDAEMDAIRGLMWPPTATEDDLARWHNQGFTFPPSLPPSLTFGLAQGQGGPCGVLAAVQGEMVRLLVFEGGDEHGNEGGKEEGEEGGKDCDILPTSDAAEVLQALAQALVHVLERARPTERELEEEGADSNSSSSSCGDSSSSTSSRSSRSSSRERGQIYLVTPSLPSSLPSSSSSSSSSSSFVLAPHTSPSELEVRTFPQAQAAVEFLIGGGGLVPFQTPAGVLLFVYSLLLTRGPSLSRGDTDDADLTTLTGRFGHCSQELLNLLLVGKAVSNVFDGDKELGDSGLKLRGVPARATIGYLTHLEALRYVQVGSHYKTPQVPIWVVGSSSHFTVLFALEKGCNEESRGEALLARVQRVFQTHDPSEGGFIQVSDLQHVLIELDLLSVALDEGAMEKMSNDLEVQGAGIILFDQFWQKISPLLLAKQGGGGGSGMDVVHETEEDDNASSDTGTSTAPSSLPASFPPANLDHQGEGGREGGRARSDSEIARELQAQFDQADEAAAAAAAGLSTLSAPAPPPSSPTHASARMVVEEEEGKGEEHLATSSTATGAPAAAPASAEGGGGGGGGGRGGRLMRSSSITGPLSFTLYHYNGLSSGGRSPTLTRFSLTKSPRQGTAALVGHSVALGTSPMGSGAAFSCPIEEVLATKWPGARFNWLGAAPPSID